MALVWKSIPDYEDLYKISNTGLVRSFKRNTTSGKILSPGFDKDGYLLVILSKNGKHKTSKIHKLVATVFIREIKNSEQVNHINLVKADNRVENLEICSSQENMAHYYKSFKGKLKITRKQVDQIINLVKNEGLTQSKVAAMFNCYQADVSNYVNKKRRIYQY